MYHTVDQKLRVLFTTSPIINSESAFVRVTCSNSDVLEVLKSLNVPDYFCMLPAHVAHVHNSLATADAGQCIWRLVPQ